MFINIHNGGVASTNEPLPIVTCQGFYWSKIETTSEVQKSAGMENIWLVDNDI